MLIGSLEYVYAKLLEGIFNKTEFIQITIDKNKRIADYGVGYKVKEILKRRWGVDCKEIKHSLELSSIMASSKYLEVDLLKLLKAAVGNVAKKLDVELKPNNTKFELIGRMSAIFSFPLNIKTNDINKFCKEMYELYGLNIRYDKHQTLSGELIEDDKTFRITIEVATDPGVLINQLFKDNMFLDALNSDDTAKEEKQVGVARTGGTDKANAALIERASNGRAGYDPEVMHPAALPLQTAEISKDPHPAYPAFQLR